MSNKHGVITKKNNNSNNNTFHSLSTVTIMMTTSRCFLLTFSALLCLKNILFGDHENTVFVILPSVSAFVTIDHYTRISAITGTRIISIKQPLPQRNYQKRQNGDYCHHNIYCCNSWFSRRCDCLSTFMTKKEQQQGMGNHIQKAEKEDGFVWIPATSDPILVDSDDYSNKDRKEDMIQLKKMEDYARVVLYDDDVTKLPSSSQERSKNQFKRWLRLSSSSQQSEKYSTTKNSNPTETQTSQANHITKQTLSWCKNFVSRLTLCPWANASLSTPNAVRVKIIPESFFFSSDGSNSLEHVLRCSALELLRVTNHAEEDQQKEICKRGKIEKELNTKNTDINKEEICCKERGVDPNVAITFVVIAPTISTVGPTISPSPLYSYQDTKIQFESFLERVTDIEESWFDEADEINERIEEQGRLMDDNKDNIPLGDLITLAPFHPHWHFASPQEEEDDYDDSYNEEDGEEVYYSGDNSGFPTNNITDEGDKEQAIDYEKRTPYPTISLVRTSAIVAGGGEEATKRIGKHNDEVLNDVGLHALKKLFRDEVLLMKNNSKGEEKETCRNTVSS